MKKVGVRQDAALESSFARILIVDDNSASSSLLNTLVTRAGFSVVGRVTNGFDALHQAEYCAPSMMLLDLDMQRMEGLATLRQVRKYSPWLPVLVVSMLEPGIYALRCMRLGAKGFLDKGEGLGLLSCAIIQISQGHMMFPDLPVGSSGPLDELSDYELVALRCLVRGCEVGETATTLNINRARVQLLIRSLQTKLGLEGNEALAGLGRKLGLG